LSSLRHFISCLREQNEIVDVFHEVDASLEIAEIHRRVVAANGPALFFHRVKNSSFPVVTNLFGTKNRMERAFPHHPEERIASLITLLTKEFPPSLKTLWKRKKEIKDLIHIGLKTKKRAPVKECLVFPPDLEKLPLLKTWPLDGGSFITLPLVYTESPEGGSANLGMYRIQRYDKKTAGLHFQIAKGGGFHYDQAEKQNCALPVNIFIGGSPALMLSAITPLPENVPELLFSSFLQNRKVRLSPSSFNQYPLLADAEFALVGEALPHKRLPEGPFGDHYGYYSLAHDFPVFSCKALYHRKDAIYPATIVGKPRQEDFYIGNYLQKLLPPLFPVVMPGVKKIWSFAETGFHSLTAAICKERYQRECMTTAFRILGEGQLSLSKFLLMTDQNIAIDQIKEVLPTVLERFHPETDLYIFSNLSLDTLDYTGPSLNKGSRGILVGVGEKLRDLPQSYQGPLPLPLTAAAAFCPGCLVLEAPPYEKFQQITPLLQRELFSKWPLLILVDNLKKTLKNEASFLWSVFTRFEPAGDIYAKSSRVIRHHIAYSFPLLIDARMKPSYPPEVLCDAETAEKVSKNWSQYFPQGMASGDSMQGHVC